jgi:uncharacterized membrane protein
MAKIISIVLVCLSFLIAIYFYPQMPDIMVSHWNAQGQANGYMTKAWALFMLPVIFTIITVLFFLIPKIDPLKANIEKFKKYYYNFIALISLFFFYVYFLSILWNLGLKLDMSRLLPPALGILFYFCGVLVENAKRNYFIGIRTPWTLSSDAVWDKTHKLGGKLFKISGVITFFGIFFPKVSFFLLFATLLPFTVFIFIYSYFEYKKENKQ